MFLPCTRARVCVLQIDRITNHEFHTEFQLRGYAVNQRTRSLSAYDGRNQQQQQQNAVTMERAVSIKMISFKSRRNPVTASVVCPLRPTCFLKFHVDLMKLVCLSVVSALVL